MWADIADHQNVRFFSKGGRFAVICYNDVSTLWISRKVFFVVLSLLAA